MKNYSKEKVQCDICGKIFSVYGIYSHKQWHINEERRQQERDERKLNPKKRGPNTKIKNYEYLQLRDDLFCRFCEKQCKNQNSLKQHEIRCSKNPNRIAYDHLLGHTSIPKGSTKETSEVIRKQLATKKKKKESGWIERHRPHLTIHKYKEHNNEEIQKWINYVSELEIDIPKYKVYNNGGYTVVSDSVLTDEYNQRNGTYTVLLEHVYFMTLLFGEAYQTGNVVHHIDEDKSNNNFNNLILFESVQDHIRFHKSDNAYLIYNNETHKFTCKIVDTE